MPSVNHFPREPRDLGNLDCKCFLGESVHYSFDSRMPGEHSLSKRAPAPSPIHGTKVSVVKDSFSLSSKTLSDEERKECQAHSEKRQRCPSPGPSSVSKREKSSEVKGS